MQKDQDSDSSDSENKGKDPWAPGRAVAGSSKKGIDQLVLSLKGDLALLAGGGVLELGGGRQTRGAHLHLECHHAAAHAQLPWGPGPTVI